MIIISSSMIRMTWIRDVGVLRSFLFIFLPSFRASFVSPSFLPLFLSSLAFLPSFRGSPFVPFYLPSFLPSFVASFFSPSFLPSFLSPGIPSFLPFSRHAFLPSFLNSFLLIFLPSLLASFLSPDIPSFLPSLPSKGPAPSKKIFYLNSTLPGSLMVVCGVGHSR